MSDTLAQIRAALEAQLAPEFLDIEDDSAAHAGHAGARSGGGHYNVTIVSAAFRGKTLPARHRLVYQALDGLMGSQIHALAIRALTPEQL